MLQIYSALKTFTRAQPFGGNANTYYKTNKLMGHPGDDLVSTYKDSIMSTSSLGERVYKILNRNNPDIGKFRAVCTLVEDGDKVYELQYGHVIDIFVKEGDWLRAGAVIATEGNTGEVWSNGIPVTVEERKNGSKAGTHLHFQVRECTKVTTTYTDKQYLIDANGALYKDAQGFYYLIPNFDNGFNGCIDPKRLYNNVSADIVPKLAQIAAILQDLLKGRK